MDIHAIKQALNDVGYGPLNMDAGVGADTIAAIKKFQADKGLDSDGIPGPKTFAALFPTRPEAGIVIDSPILRIRAMQYMQSKNGVREATGKNDGPDVEIFLASVGLPKGYSWCMALVYWAYMMAAHDLGVPNPLKRTGGVMDQYNHMKALGLITHTPSIGDVFILDLGNGAGHTGVVVLPNADGSNNTVEGNTDDTGSANGDGIYIDRVRYTDHILGFIHIP